MELDYGAAVGYNPASVPSALAAAVFAENAAGLLDTAQAHPTESSFRSSVRQYFCCTMFSKYFPIYDNMLKKDAFVLTTWPVQRHAGWPKRNTFGKKERQTGTKAFPLPLSYASVTLDQHVAARKLAHFVQRLTALLTEPLKGDL